MLKPTETLKKFQVFGKNCKNFKFLEKIAKISKFSEKIAKISSLWKKLQISQGFGKFFVASDLIFKNMGMFRV